MLPSGLMDQLVDPKWKERLEACDKFKQVQISLSMQHIEYTYMLLDTNLEGINLLTIAGSLDREN